jgi:hypothetical protein
MHTQHVEHRSLTNFGSILLLSRTVDILSAYSPVEGRSVRIGIDHKTIGTSACCQVGRPNKKCSADTATQGCRFDEQLEEVCSASDDFDLRNANNHSVLFRNRD